MVLVLTRIDLKSLLQYTFVHLIFLALIRAFGSYGVVLPLLLGQLPNRAFESSDTYLWSLATGLFYSGFFVAHVLPPKIHKFFLYVNRFCHSVIRGNSLGHGFSMTVLHDTNASYFYRSPLTLEQDLFRWSSSASYCRRILA